MESKLLTEKTYSLWAELKQKINDLKLEKKNTLEYAQYALAETDDAIRTLKSWVITHDFDCWESEITFFKKLKPKFIAKFIYYSKVITLLSSLPHSGSKLKKGIYEAELEYLRYFSLEHSEFISYCRRNATYMDFKYFLRFKYDLDVKLAVDIHSYDERFSTSHDHLVSKMIAHDEYEVFLTAQIARLKEGTFDETVPKQNFRWTASKVGLTELVFALHHTNCFNGGNTSLAETVKWFEEAFSVELGNYHNTMAEIKTRKSNPTKFLKQLSDNLTAYIEKDDGVLPPSA
ncbi:RteC domain-containing protein [Kaistella sp. DKR-2]|uniref:RteC domain-containing protein n=1 Tax=Kaistella soli TaxID=2849654 RepID=UPI001C274DE1|nr:RteC domain-containing protein [Kaistella soli]MBU8883046.1 RteC domain-containing protein [Kaistella soli]